MSKTILIALLAGAICAGASHATGYKIDWCSINSGGGLVSGGIYKLNSSAGQPAAGFVQNTSYIHWIGFWAGDLPEPIVPDSVAAAKMLPDGAYVSIAGRIATSAASDFTGFFYVEEEDRSSGMRVTVAAPVPDLLRGSVVNVIGTLGKTPEGERCLTGPIVIVVGSHKPLTPLGMPNRSLGGADWGLAPLSQYGVAGGVGVNNVGLLIRTWGRVTETGSGYAVIDDGSGTPVRLDTSTLADPPVENEYISVIGISSLYLPDADRLRLVLPRTDSDIFPY